MDSDNEVCPVCTLYLRPGITLQSHLNSHPKQKVIEALINLANLKGDKNSVTATTSGYESQAVNRTGLNQSSITFPSISTPPNHSFIYQQFMSTSQPPTNQHYVTIPTGFNSSLMCLPYVYQQQQQLFMSSPALSNVLRSRTPNEGVSISETIPVDHQKIVVNLEEEEQHVTKSDENNESDILSHQFVPEEVDIDEKSIGSPNSDYLRLRQDLNKACQTRQGIENEEVEGNALTTDAYKFFPEPDVVTATPTNDQVLNLNGMQLVLCNDFEGGQVISQVHDFECNNEQPVLMNIGAQEFNNWEVNDNTTNNFQEEALSQHSATNLCIRANENMPPRGELSGQESNGTASDITWNRVQNDSNSAISCDLFARETWEGSDYEEAAPLSCTSPRPAHIDEGDDVPTIISVTEAPLNFKCPSCGKGFKCPKERKAHQSEEHNKTIEKTNTLSNNVIGAKVPSKFAVKKLIIKPKRAHEIKNEDNFEYLLNNHAHKNEGNTENVEIESRTDGNENLLSEIDIKNTNCSECTFCGLVFSDLKALNKHTQFEHIFPNRFKCDTCSEIMRDQKSFMAHLKIHPLECKICGKYFYRRQNIQLHMKRHLGIKPFQCEFCPKAFFAKQKLFEHRNTHTGDAPIQCNMCNETFRRHSNLVQHRKLHHLMVGKKVKDYVCHCGEVVHSKKKLAWHKEIHNPKPKACTKCSEKFIHMASLTRHMRRSHNSRFVPEEDRNNENVECPICKNVYLKSSMEAHIRRHAGAKEFVCLICKREFTTKWNLKLHNWVHASRSTKPFKCEHCKAAFIRESDFTAHMNSHKCIKPYTCNHCGAKFIRKSNCQRHVKEHELEKTFACQLCGKSFHRSYYLKDHMKIHSGARPFACHICGKTSSTKSNHNKHVMIHHAKEPVSTEN